MTFGQKLQVATMIVNVVAIIVIVVLSIRLRKVNQQTLKALNRTRVHAEAMGKSAERLARTLRQR